MRQTLAKNYEARIILGGKLKGYVGRYPGIVEEALETIIRDKALYIVGGFGGAARAVYEAIVIPSGQTPLREAWQDHCRDEKVHEMHASYLDLAKQLNLGFSLDHEAMLELFKDFGPKKLSEKNKLTAAENKRLAYSQDVHEILAILVRGLNQLHVDLAAQKGAVAQSVEAHTAKPPVVGSKQISPEICLTANANEMLQSPPYGPRS